MRYALMLAGAVLLIGVLAEQGFQAAFPAPQVEPMPPAVINGPYSRPSSKLLVSDSEDRQRKQRIRRNRTMVTRRNDHSSNTRRGLPTVGRRAYHPGR